MGLLESLRNRGGLLGTVGQTLTDYQQLANAYPNASKFAEGLIKNLSAVAPPDPRNQQQSMQYAINRAFDVPGGFGGAIDVWHGSPHKFDAFDMSKIGTGEGAQAYGHGLYFAENPEVAKGYREKLASDNYGDIYNDFSTGFLTDIESGTRKYWEDVVKENEHLLGDESVEDVLLNGNYYKNEYVDPKWFEGFLRDDLIKTLNKNGGQFGGDEAGAIYKTSLQWPDAAKETSDPLGPQHFLDWDKPLSEQPESVKSAWQSMFGDMPEPKGPLGRTLKGLMAEEDLKGQGIPGIRYLDGGSRGAGNGSYNYVVFDDQIPRILERNGIGLLNSLKR